MEYSITAVIEYDKDDDNMQKVINLDPNTKWDDFKLIISCMLLCPKYRVYYLDDENDEISVSSEEEFREAFRVAMKSNSIHFKIVSTNSSDPLAVFCEVNEINNSDCESFEKSQFNLEALSFTDNFDENTEVKLFSPHASENSSFDFNAMHFDPPPYSDKSNMTERDILTSSSASSQHYIQKCMIDINDKLNVLLNRTESNDNKLINAKSIECQTVASCEKSIQQHNLLCDACNFEIEGIYYKCGNCREYNLCITCEKDSLNLHNHDHVFLKIKRPLPKFAIKKDKYGNAKPIIKRILYEDRKRRQNLNNCDINIDKINESSKILESTILRRRSKFSDPKLDAFIIGECSQPEGSEINPGTSFFKEWIVMNAGGIQWNADVRLEYLWGNLPSTSNSFPVPPLKPKETGAIRVELILPNEPGTYTCHWRLTVNGRKFGKRVWCTIVVPKNKEMNDNLCNDHEIERKEREFQDLFKNDYITHKLDDQNLKEEVDADETLSTDSGDFLIINMPDCFDITKPLPLCSSLDTIKDSKESQIKCESEHNTDTEENFVECTDEPEIVDKININLENDSVILSKINDENSKQNIYEKHETVHENSVLCNETSQNELDGDKDIVSVDETKLTECKFVAVEEVAKLQMANEDIVNEHPAFLQTAFGAVNKVASAAFDTTKNVFQAFQAQNRYVPPKSTWVPKKDDYFLPMESEKEWIKKQILQKKRRDNITTLISMGFANRQQNNDLLSKHDNNMEIVIEELISSQEAPVRH